MSCNVELVSGGAGDSLVSIPIGFSNELQHTPRSIAAPTRTEFQSLSGFPMSCNGAVEGLPGIHVLSFNPYRVFQ